MSRLKRNATRLLRQPQKATLRYDFLDHVFSRDLVLLDPPCQLLYFCFEFLLLTYGKHFVVISVLLILEHSVKLCEKQPSMMPV